MSDFFELATDCWVFLIAVAIFITCGITIVSLIKREYRGLKNGRCEVGSFAKRLLMILVIMFYGIYALILIDQAILLWNAIF